MRTSNCWLAVIRVHANAPPMNAARRANPQQVPCTQLHQLTTRMASTLAPHAALCANASSAAACCSGVPSRRSTQRYSSCTVWVALNMTPAEAGWGIGQGWVGGRVGG